jgi:large conductance mechanosensitive channel
MIRKNVAEFIDFIRDKGVLGLAVGIIMGGAVTRLVTSIIDNLVNPLLGALTGAAGNLNELTYTIPYTHIVFKWGAFLSSLLDFLAIVLVIYVIFIKTPILSKLDKKKEEK